MRNDDARGDPSRNYDRSSGHDPWPLFLLLGGRLIDWLSVLGHLKGYAPKRRLGRADARGSWNWRGIACCASAPLRALLIAKLGFHEGTRGGIVLGD